LCLGYADPKPIDPTRLTVGGDWPSHYYNGADLRVRHHSRLPELGVHGGEVRGARKLDRLNPQTQEFTVSDDDGDSD
jgi:hypothetical protein